MRQGVDESGMVVSTWLFDPDGTLLEGPQDLVSHLVCSGVYDWSTGLIYQNGHYFDPRLGIWLALLPLLVVQVWPGRKRRTHGRYSWLITLCIGLSISGILTACKCETEKFPVPTHCVEKSSNVFYPQPNKTFEPQVKLPVVYNQYTDTVPESVIPLPDAEAERIKNAACGATCMAMVLTYYEYPADEANPVAVISKAKRNGYWDNERGGITAANMATFFDEEERADILHPGGYGFAHVKYYDKGDLRYGRCHSGNG